MSPEDRLTIRRHNRLEDEIASFTRDRDAMRNEWRELLIERVRLMALRDDAIAERDEARRDGLAMRELLAVAFREGWNCGDWGDGKDNVSSREYDWMHSAVKAKADAALTAATAQGEA